MLVAKECERPPQYQAAHSECDNKVRCPAKSSAGGYVPATNCADNVEQCNRCGSAPHTGSSPPR
eukprot:1141751-Rhodomonas_salina.2